MYGRSIGWPVMENTDDEWGDYRGQKESQTKVSRGLRLSALFDWPRNYSAICFLLSSINKIVPFSTFDMGKCSQIGAFKDHQNLVTSGIVPLSPRWSVHPSGSLSFL